MPDNSNYQFGSIPNNLLDMVKSKAKSSKYYFEYLLLRTKKMFEYKNLPDSIEADILERYLQLNGVCCITKYKDKLYAFNGSLGGEQDVYYRPTIFVVSNPHLDQTFSKNVIISSQLADYNKQPTNSQIGVLMRNDSEWVGLTPLLARYAVLMAENCLTIRSADVMLRIIALITAKSDKSLKSAMDYLKRLENGEFGVIGDSSFSEGIKMQSPPSNNGSYLTQFIELQQYLKGSFFGELGLRANYNMKREAIGQGESTLDEDAILPLCDNMLTCRQQDVAKINEIYGTDISVDFSSAWLRNHIENNITLLSQLTESGLAKLQSSQLEESSGDLGQLVADTSRDESGSSWDISGTGRDNMEGVENDGTRGADEEVGRTDTDVSGDESRGTGEGAEIRDISDDRQDESENGNVGEDVDKESCINDLSGDTVAEEMMSIVKDAASQLEVEKEKNDEFLGSSEGSGIEENSSDDKRDIQQDELSVESGNNS